MKFLDLDAAPGGSGTSWDDPYDLTSLVVNAGDEIWVKEHEGYTMVIGVPVVVNNVTLYGGFDSSLTGTDGDVNDRTGYTKMVSDGVLHELFTVYATGFTLSRFWSNDFVNNSSGGVIRSYGAGPSFADCVFENCEALIRGGAIWSTQDLTVQRCSFIRCTAADDGGAISVTSGLLSISDSLITNCISEADGGGGISAYDIEMDRCGVFNCRANSATGDGGGIMLRTLSGTNYVRDSVIAKNVAENDHGGIHSFRFVPSSTRQ